MCFVCFILFCYFDGTWSLTDARMLGGRSFDELHLQAFLSCLPRMISTPRYLERPPTQSMCLISAP